MFKKLSIWCCTLFLIIQLMPASPVIAETVQDVPTGTTTISSKAEDPLKDYKEKAQETIATTESSNTLEDETDTTVESELESTEETSPTEESATSDASPKQTREGGSISPQATITLIEGDHGIDPPDSYHIDRKFAELLRTNKTTTNNHNPWSGYGKAPGTLTSDDMERLSEINVAICGLTSLKGVEYATNLKDLSAGHNEITEINVSKNVALTDLVLFENPITELDVTQNTSLITLSIGQPITGGQIIYPLRELDVSKNTSLNALTVSGTLITELDISKNTALTRLRCHTNKLLTELDVSKNTALTELRCHNNELRELDVSKNTALTRLSCQSNQLTELDVSKNTALTNLECQNNELTELDVSKNTALQRLDCTGNHLTDITSARYLSSLNWLNCSPQTIVISVPPISNDGKAEIDILRTTAHAGLSATNIDINPAPATITPDGDKIKLTGVTRDSLSGKSIRFSYNRSQLIEGSAASTSKFFSGTITFKTVSELRNELTVAPNKTTKDGEVAWTWTITSLTDELAKNIRASFTLPNLGSITDIEVNGMPGNINQINGTTSLGDLSKDGSIVITFKTTFDPNVIINPGWKEGVARVDWEDATITSPYFKEAKQKVRLLDEEQTDTPHESEDMGILSVPIYFNYGVKQISSSLQTYNLNPQNYQTNTNVVSDGFYTRIKDDRSSNTGWKLRASLSDFTDSSSQAMPNGQGTSLQLNNLSIGRVTDRDTPQEVVDYSPTGSDVPGTVKSSETLVAGEPAKTLVEAGNSQGAGTWQLRMPFDDVSLNLPANAGKKSTFYKARLTWSLEDTI